jgi:hypothetical protein
MEVEFRNCKDYRVEPHVKSDKPNKESVRNVRSPAYGLYSFAVKVRALTAMSLRFASV